MKNILIPTDFSENSWNAIKYGLDYFKNTQCNFYLLNVTMVSNYATTEFPLLTTGEVIEKTQMKQSKIALNKILKKISKLPKNNKHKFYANVVFDFFVDAVLNEVIDKNIDLVLMGTKGASGIEEVIIGSNTGDVIKKVKCPILVVPEKAMYVQPKEIVFPTDYTVFHTPKTLFCLSEVAKHNKATIRILNVVKKGEVLSDYQNENKEFLDNFFENEKHSFHQLTNKKLEAGIQCFIESRDINLIVMVAKNLNIFEQLFFVPTVEEISYHINIPFLVLHE